MLTTKPPRQRKQVNLEIAPGLRRAVRAEARRQGVTFSAFVRVALRSALEAARIKGAPALNEESPTQAA